MSNFALDTNTSQEEIVSSLNYVLANLGNTLGISGNVLVANTTTGEITNNSNNQIIAYLYQYINVRYATSADGSTGFSTSPTNATYFGIRNTTTSTGSSNPADYVWTQVTGGFGTTKLLWYAVIGGRQILFFVDTTAPATNYLQVQDGVAIDLDIVTGFDANQLINVNAYFQSNTTPATPTGGYYDFSTYTLTPPATWSATIPAAVANTSVYVSQNVFAGNATANVAPSIAWSTPAEYITTFNANAGPAGSRGFVPLGFVVAPSDPSVASNATLTSWFGASRSAVTPPIGLGYAPIANDTAQFFWANLTNRANDVTVTKTFDGNVWTSVDSQVVSGDLIYPGTITANALSVNSIYSVTIQSTNATMGNTSSAGYWLQANTGDARFGGNVSIGNTVTVGNIITAGSINANTINTDNLILGAASQVVYAEDDQNVNVVPWVNGPTWPTSGSYWPTNTRGFGVAGGATITPTTTGSVGGSKIVINYNATISSILPQYNLVELWKTGASVTYLQTFQRVSCSNYNRWLTSQPTPWTLPTYDSFLAVTNTAVAKYSTDGGITWTSVPTVPSGLNQWGTLVNRARTYDTGTATWQDYYWNAESFGYAGRFAGGGGVDSVTAPFSYLNSVSLSPASNTNFYGATNLANYYAQQNQSSDIIVGSGAVIISRNPGESTTYTVETAPTGVVSDLYDIAIDRSPLASNVSSIVTMAVGTGGTIIKDTRTYSTADGSLSSHSGWTQIITGTAQHLNGICSNWATSSTSYFSSTPATIWVAVGNNGTILTSTDSGNNWTARSSGTSYNLNSVAYGNDRWIAVGQNGTVLTSTDSITWTAATSATVRNLYSVTYGFINKNFVACGDDVIVSSPSGTLNWQVRYSGSAVVNSAFTRLAYYGSSANLSSQSLPTIQSQIGNTQIAGTYTDYSYASGTSVTYYLVLGNLTGNTVVYTGAPSLTVTEYKR